MDNPLKFTNCKSTKFSKMAFHHNFVIDQYFSSSMLCFVRYNAQIRIKWPEMNLDEIKVEYLGDEISLEDSCVDLQMENGFIIYLSVIKELFVKIMPFDYQYEVDEISGAVTLYDLRMHLSESAVQEDHPELDISNPDETPFLYEGKIQDDHLQLNHFPANPLTFVVTKKLSKH